MVLFSYNNIYALLPSSWLAGLLRLFRPKLSLIMGDLAVLLNKIFPFLLAFDFKELQITCKFRHMKCFQQFFQIAS